MRKLTKYVIVFIILLVAAYFILPRFTKHHLPITINPSKKESDATFLRIRNNAIILRQFCVNNHYNKQMAFIIDMQLHSGKKRFFVYDFMKDTIVHSGLVAHGSCNTHYLNKAKFSNKIGCGCSALGKYKIANSYVGRFGKAYKLYGLEASNSNAFDRNIVLHAYDCVPNEATYPQPICNSLGCAMVSYTYLKTLSDYIDKTKKPLVLWVMN